MPQAYKCRTCGEITVSTRSHNCSQNFITVSLDPKDYCAKLGHSYEEKEISGTQKTYERLTSISEYEQKYIKFKGHEVLVTCTVCNGGFRKWKEKRID